MKPKRIILDSDAVLRMYSNIDIVIYMDNNTIWILIGGIVLLYLWKSFGPGRAATAKVVREKIAAGAAVIDVRSGGEFSSGSYPGARNIPLDTLSQRMGKIGPKDRGVVVFCASGSRSAQAVRLLRSAGFTDVTNAGALHSMPR